MDCHLKSTIYWENVLTKTLGRYHRVQERASGQRAGKRCEIGMEGSRLGRDQGTGRGGNFVLSMANHGRVYMLAFYGHV